MTLQWTAVALFLYSQIAVLLILSLPLVSAQRWQNILQLKIWQSVGPYLRKGFLTMIVILVVLFLDAVREVRKYSVKEPFPDDILQPNASDHLNMKLFRAQRNIYISGFSLFFWLVIRRIFSLIGKLATTAQVGLALQSQVEGAIQAAKKYLEDNEQLKEALAAGNQETVKMNEGLRKELDMLRAQLRIKEDVLQKSNINREALRKQIASLSQEHEQLVKDHLEMQVSGTEDKKEQ